MLRAYGDDLFVSGNVVPGNGVTFRCAVLLYHIHMSNNVGSGSCNLLSSQNELSEVQVILFQHSHTDGTAHKHTVYLMLIDEGCHAVHIHACSLLRWCRG